jgi:DNA-binding NtrC family response regulator
MNYFEKIAASAGFFSGFSRNEGVKNIMMEFPRKVFNAPSAEKTYEILEVDSGADPKTMLLLDDDSEFTEILKAELEANNFSVICVKNGVSGLKKIMIEDFDVILCDMVMPNLPGDMFYLAVQRIKPHLCKRFIFMTGHKGEKKIDEFIRSVHGIMLWKPFQFHDLLEAVTIVSKKTTEKF